MLNSSALISAKRVDSGRIVVTVGSYKNLGQAGGGMWTGGTPGMGPVFMPTGGVGNSRSKFAHFRMLLDSSSFEFVPSEMHPDITERIEEYTKEISVPDQGENLFLNNGRYVYAYYNRDEHKLMLLNF